MEKKRFKKKDINDDDDDINEKKRNTENHKKKKERSEREKIKDDDHEQKSNGEKSEDTNTKRKATSKNKYIPQTSPIKEIDNQIKNIDNTKKYHKKAVIHKVPITFVFNNTINSRKKYCSQEMLLDINTTMKELQNMTSESYDIKEKVEFQYKEKGIAYTIDREMQINDVIDEIQTNGKNGVKNILYVNIVPQSKRKRKHIDADEESEEDSHDSNIELIKNIDKYKVIRKLGSGAHSIVKLVEYNKETFAAKEIINNNNSIYSCLEREIPIMGSLDHERLMKIKGYSLTGLTGNNRLTIIMPFMKNGSLRDFLNKRRNKKFSKSELKILNTKLQIILIDILLGIIYLHDKNIMHRDLKPENILLDEDNHIVISDFGISKIYKSTETQTLVVGTPIYTAPEVCESENYDLKVDIYSFSMILYEIVTGIRPYENLKKISGIKLLNDVKEGKRPSFDSPVNDCLKELIQKCWDANPENRPSFKHILYLLTYKKNYYLQHVNAEEILSYAEEKQIKKIAIPKD